MALVISQYFPLWWLPNISQYFPRRALSDTVSQWSNTFNPQNCHLSTKDSLSRLLEISSISFFSRLCGWYLLIQACTFRLGHVPHRNIYKTRCHQLGGSKSDVASFSTPYHYCVHGWKFILHRFQIKEHAAETLAIRNLDTLPSGCEDTWHTCFSTASLCQ